MARKKSTSKGHARKQKLAGSRLAYDNTRQEKRKLRHKSRRKRSDLQKVHEKFMKKELRKLNRKGGKPTTNMKKASRAWKKSPLVRKQCVKEKEKVKEKVKEKDNKIFLK